MFQRFQTRVTRTMARDSSGSGRAFQTAGRPRRQGFRSRVQRAWRDRRIHRCRLGRRGHCGAAVVAVPVGADGMIARTGWTVAVVVVDQGRCMSGI